VLADFASLKSTVQQTWQRLNPQQVAVIGCGSAYYLAQCVAALLQTVTGVPARAYPASELILFPAQTIHNPAETLLLAISRSGTTTETVTAIEHFRQSGGGQVWAITCDAGSLVAQAADLVLPVEAAQEQSLAQTRSFSSMLLLAQAVAATVAGEDDAILRDLPAHGEQVITQANTFIAGVASRTDVSGFFFLGSGILYGLANEGMLKLKEMSITGSEAYHFLEFRHGPKAMVDQQTLMIGLISNSTRQHEQQVLYEMRDLGADILAINAAGSSEFAHAINLDGKLPAWASPVLYLPTMQLLGYHRAISKGLDPDLPRNLQAVIHLDAQAF